MAIHLHMSLLPWLISVCWLENRNSAEVERQMIAHTVVKLNIKVVGPRVDSLVKAYARTADNLALRAVYSAARAIRAHSNSVGAAFTKLMSTTQRS